MQIEMTSLIRQLAVSLDFVEAELFGIKTNHGKRLSLLCVNMARALRLSEEEIMTLSLLAPLHDNALTEFIASELGDDKKSLWKHCSAGQKNIENLCFPSSVKDIILYHHERPDGKGIFGKKDGEISVEAEILALADFVDLRFGLGHLSKNEIPAVLEFVGQNIGTQFFKSAADAFIKVFNENLLEQLKYENIEKSLGETSTEFYADLNNKNLIDLADFVMTIIDYKSKFTRKHSSQIANRAWLMAKFYNYNIDNCIKLYVSAAFHDLGKLTIPPHILEKAGSLTNEEFEIIKSHVFWTHELLKEIKGFEEICYIAAAHHEKFDGTGYPFGRKADELDFFSRLLAVIDIYQAISEERPYHPQRNHEDTMKIIFSMAQKGFIDEKIVKDIDIAMKPFSMKNVPDPIL
jgi:HD-GYP domain-containing protein (c-di-GMP phosphodiesterase class II)